MKAVIANQPGGPEVLQLVEVDPPELAQGEVRIKVKAFGLNKAESYYRSGNYGTFVPGQALGIEAVGAIEHDPSGRFSKGQKVATAMGGMMFGRHGGYAEFINVLADNVVSIDSDLAFVDLAALPEVYSTIWGALDKNLEIRSGQSILVRGATSGLGMAGVIYAKLRGLTVVATTRSEKSRSALMALGADHVLIDDGDINVQIRDIFTEGVDACLEVVGAATLLDSLKSVKLWGGVSVVGLLGGPPILNEFNLMGDLPNTVRLSFFSSGLLGSDSMPLSQSPLNEIAQKLDAGEIPNIKSHVFDVEDIRKAHSLLDSGKAMGKIVVQF